MKDIAERLKEYLSDEVIDGVRYDRIVLLVPDIEDALKEIHRLRVSIQTYEEAVGRLSVLSNKATEQMEQLSEANKKLIDAISRY